MKASCKCMENSKITLSFLFLLCATQILSFTSPDISHCFAKCKKLRVRNIHSCCCIYSIFYKHIKSVAAVYSKYILTWLYTRITGGRCEMWNSHVNKEMSLTIELPEYKIILTTITIIN